MSKNLVRLSQLVSSFGPGAMLDLPGWSVMIAGLDRWDEKARRPVVEPRLLRRLPEGHERGLATPPLHEESPYRKDAPKLQAIVFPNWFVSTRVEENGARVRRRLVRLHELDLKSRTLVEGSGRARRSWPVVPVRFVAACPRGHVQDIDWRLFVHRGADDCLEPLWLEESEATGDVADTRIVCGCGQSRSLYEALGADTKVLWRCRGMRPWLGPDQAEQCDQHLRLLVRTASNAYFPLVLTALSLPTETEADRLDRLVAERARDLEEVRSVEDVPHALRFNPALREALHGFEAQAIWAAIERMRDGSGASRAKVKVEEFDVLANAPAGSRTDPRAVLVTEPLARERWDPEGRFPIVERLILVHRLRVVTALRGFTRFDFVTADKDGELDPHLQVQELSVDPHPYPAIEQRGEGLFVQLSANRVQEWLARPEVAERADALERGYQRWCAERGASRGGFPGAAYIALHTLSHLLSSEVALESGYPLSALHERVYAIDPAGYGILLYAASIDVGGTLGGLVALGPRLADLLARAIERASICSNDPVCAEHDPGRDPSGHPLAGAACHGCVLLPEPCCEMRNDFLDRALAIGTLVAPRLGLLTPRANG